MSSSGGSTKAEPHHTTTCTEDGEQVSGSSGTISRSGVYAMVPREILCEDIGHLPPVAEHLT